MGGNGKNLAPLLTAACEHSSECPHDSEATYCDSFCCTRAGGREYERRNKYDGKQKIEQEKDMAISASLTHWENLEVAARFQAGPTL